MRSNTKKPACVKSLAVLLLCTAAGCDEIPALPVPPAASVGSEVIADQGRGGYNWRLNGFDFEMQRPTGFAYVAKLKPEVIRRSLEVPKFEEPTTSRKPEGMDDDVYSWFRRLTGARSVAQQVMELEQSEEVGTKCACLNPEGTRLLTVAKKLIEWDVATGKRVKEFDAPIDGCIAVVYDPALETVVLQNATSLARVSLEDGRVLHRWKAPEGQIEAFAGARDVDAQAVVTTGNQLYALADDFSKVRTYRDKPLASKRIAIHPKGSWILGVTQGAMLRWRLDQGDGPVELMPSETIDEANCIAMAGTLVDRWTNPWVVHEFKGMQQRYAATELYPYLFVNALVLTATNATVDGSQDWMVIVGERRDAQGQRMRFVQDLHFDMLDRSVPCPLPMMDFEACFFDASGERLAFVVGNKLRVFERSRWSDPDGVMTAQRVAALLFEGRTEQMELCAKELRSQPVFRGGVRGEQVYSAIVDSLGSMWTHLEKEPAAPEIMQAIDKWYQSGSELALLGSAQRHLNIGYAARGEDYADQVSAQNWAVLEQRMQKAYADLAKLPQREQPSAYELLTLINMAKMGDTTFQDAEKWLEQAAELYPYNSAPLANMCNWLLPRWGGNNGEGAALVAAQAAKYPPQQGEVLYARVALRMLNIIDPQALQYESGFSALRVLDTADLVMQQDNVSPIEIETLIALAGNSQRLDLVKKLSEFHIRRFDLPTQYAYRTGVVAALGEAKEVVLGQQTDDKK